MADYRITSSLRKRFEEKVDRKSSDTGCWQWTASLSTGGYGRIYSGGAHGTPLQAHRVAYIIYVGPVPAGADLDHLCRNRRCVNPAHLEPVSRTVNARRGLKGILTTECPSGHEYTAENAGVNNRGHRYCRQCNRERIRNLRGHSARVEIRFPLQSAAAMYDAGATVVEVAEHFNVTEALAYSRLRKHGVTMRRRGTRS